MTREEKSSLIEDANEGWKDNREHAAYDAERDLHLSGILEFTDNLESGGIYGITWSENEKPVIAEIVRLCDELIELRRSRVPSDTLVRDELDRKWHNQLTTGHEEGIPGIMGDVARILSKITAPTYA